MRLCRIRNAMVACGAAVALLTAPGEASAFCCLFDWCKNLCHKPAAPATFAPVVAAPAAAPVVQQQVQYVPQTCYRTVYSNVPVTTMRPVTTTDPCTGCPVTCMRPETTYVQRAQLVPYTTYRPVVTTVQANPCVTPAPATTYYQPAAVAQPAPGCCGSTTPAAVAAPVATPSYIAPAAPAVSQPAITPGPTQEVGAPTGQPSIPPGASIGQPTYQQSNSAPSSAPPTNSQSLAPIRTPAYGAPAYGGQSSSTQQSSTPRTFAPDVSLRPIPRVPEIDEQSSEVSESNAPRLLDPNDRTTMRLEPRPWGVTQAVQKVSGSTITASTELHSTTKDADGWEAVD